MSVLEKQPVGGNWFGRALKCGKSQPKIEFIIMVMVVSIAFLRFLVCGVLLLNIQSAHEMSTRVMNDYDFE